MKSSVDSDATLRRLASAIVLGAAVVLIVAKLWGWMATGSAALLTSAADAVVDALATMATFSAFALHSDRPIPAIDSVTVRAKR